MQSEHIVLGIPLDDMSLFIIKYEKEMLAKRSMTADVNINEVIKLFHRIICDAIPV